MSNDNNILGPSLSQGQVFRKQQKTRIINNNDVITGNVFKNKNKVKNGKKNQNSKTTIEPFSLKSNSNNNGSNYRPLSKEDIENYDAKIKSINEQQKEQTRASLTSYTNVSNNLRKFQQGVTDEAKAYNNINKNSGLLNQNYLTDDNKAIRVNNAGVINTLNPSSLQQNPPLTPGININRSTQNPQPEINYIPVEDIPPGLTKGSDKGLYGQQASSKQINLPKGISGYNLEGQNVFVVYPSPNGVAAINQNMSYVGAYTNNIGLSLDSVMPSDTTLNCLQRAVDKGSSWCGMTNYGSAQTGGGGGKCMIGNPNNFSYAYNVKTISQTGWTSTLKFPSGYTSLTFGADGVLYAGYNNGYKFAYPLTTIFNNELDPTYGGTINDVIGSYAYNQGKWQNLKSFSGNYDPTGQPSGTFNTLYQYTIQVPNIAYYTYYYYNWLGQLQSSQMPYVYYTTQTAQELAAQNTAYGNLTYINYKCGKNPTKNPINVGGQNAGVGYNLDCTELYNKFPSFTLALSDNGILTITNNNTNTGSSSVNVSMTFGYPSQVTLSNKQIVTLNMPRYDDWVRGSINQGNSLTSSSSNIHSIGPKQWISSPNGFCRLILTNEGILQLEYSLQDVSQDRDGNLVGTGSSVALYSIQNVNSSNLGRSAHIDINGAVNPYPTSMVQYDNKYTENKGYIPNPATLNQSNGNSFSASDSQCRTACNNNPSCAGYVVYGNCNLLTAANMFPNSDRIPAPQYSTYIRNPKFPQNDKSCRNTLDAVIDTEAYSYYLNNGITPNPPTPMTSTTKCNLGKVLNNQMNELKQRNIAAVRRGEEIKGQFQDLFNRENNILNSISNNRTTSKIYDEYTKKAVNKIKDIQNAQITKSAAEKDSEMLVVSDNYRYIIMGIISLILSIATIKGLRMASR